jgi:hypothetical protein
LKIDHDPCHRGGVDEFSMLVEEKSRIENRESSIVLRESLKWVNLAGMDSG